MSLELDKVAPQIEALARDMKEEGKNKDKALEIARYSLAQASGKQEALKVKLDSAHSTWLAAEPLERLDTFPPCPAPPQEYTAIAADGSHLSSERYSPRKYYLINLGAALLSYGLEPGAELLSEPKLYFRPDDLVLRDPAGIEREVPVEGALLGMKRFVEEATYLASLVVKDGNKGGGLEKKTPVGVWDALDYHNKVAGSTPDSPIASESAWRTRLTDSRHPILALLDGSLVLWGLEAQKFPSFVYQALLDKGFLKALEAIRSLSGPTGIASLISLSGSTEVANMLRLYLCPYEPVNCDKHCGRKSAGERECDIVSGVGDSGLFASLLKRGQRSPLFGCHSSIMRYYGEHRVCFFYIKLDEEVSRVEMPWWLAKNKELVGLIHSLVYDQCQRGLGYPVALSEAHERAVLRAEDRELFRSLLEEALFSEDIRLAISAKDSSKRTRWI